MKKVLFTVASMLASVCLMGAYPADPLDPSPGPVAQEKTKVKKAGPREKEKEKGKAERGPEGDLRRAYELLRRIRSDVGSRGHAESRLKEWTERATRLYRDGIKALSDDDPFLAHEYGAAAHDLARAIDHARNAAQFEHEDPELPAPPAPFDHEGLMRRVRDDLYRAYERILDVRHTVTAENARFYSDAARDLYNAARRDLESKRVDRAGELARSADAMSHVAEHLGHAAGPQPPPPPRDDPFGPDPKRERGGPDRKRGRFGPDPKRDRGGPDRKGGRFGPEDDGPPFGPEDDGPRFGPDPKRERGGPPRKGFEPPPPRRGEAIPPAID